MPEELDKLMAVLGNDPGQLKRLLEAVSDALFMVDAQRNIVYWNHQAELLTGYSAKEVLGQYCLVGIRCQACLYNCNLFDQGGLHKVQISLRTKEHRVLSCTKNAFVLRDPKGTLLGGVEFLRDETELNEQIRQCKLQREKIEERERLQGAILGSIKEGVITVDTHRKITSFSRRAEAITGRSSEWAVGRMCPEVIGSELCRSNCPVRHCTESGEEDAERVTEIVTAAGTHLSIAEMCVPLKDEVGQPMGAVLIIEDRSLQNASAKGAGIRSGFGDMIGRTEAIHRVFRVIEQVAPTEATVLITGESGTGKEMVARAIHQFSNRRNGPFHAVNCAALPEALLESELFGHARGAFTGAIRDRAGRIQASGGGTLFLDEVGEIPRALQAKLLRFLQEREYERVGESKTRTADVRIVAATNRDLTAEVAQDRFRKDLYYRIRVIPIHIPPLRERREDIPLVAAHLLSGIAERLERSGLTLTPACLERLTNYNWPGNIRELVNALEYAATLAPGRRIRAEDLPPEIFGKSTRYNAGQTAPEDEKQRIHGALTQSRGNRSLAARLLGMNRVTLYRKMKQYRIT